MITATTEHDAPATTPSAATAGGGQHWCEPRDCLGETVTIVGDAVQVVPRTRRPAGPPA